MNPVKIKGKFEGRCGICDAVLPLDKAEPGKADNGLPCESIKCPGCGAMNVIIEPGDAVICDWCGEDWTNRTESGGIYGLMTKAICPDCAPKVKASAERHGESQYITAACPPGMSFADWVRKVLR